MCRLYFVPLCTFLKFHTHLEVNSARLIQNVFSKCSRVLNLVFSRKWNFSWTSPYFEACATLWLSITEISRHLHPKFLGQIQSTNIDISYKSILRCLSNNEKIEKIIWAKCSPVSATHPPPPPPPTPLMGLSYGEQSLCRVPPSPVHPHEEAPMRSCCNSFIFEAKSLICSPVGAFLLLSRGIASFWC